VVICGKADQANRVPAQCGVLAGVVPISGLNTVPS